MNTEIASTKKYDSKTRKTIIKTIKDEWKKNSDKYSSAEDFGNYMEGVLKANGFKSASGGSLTPRGVRFQVAQAGIRFKRGMPKGTKLGPRTKKAPLLREAQPVRMQQPNNPTHFSIIEEVKRIVLNNALTEAQRIKLIATYVEAA